MKNFVKLVLAGATVLAATAAAPAWATTDVAQAPDGFFVPTDAQKFDSPYYRYGGSDWSWTHNAIAAGFTSAALSVSAFDVDYASGERDNIYALDSGNWVLLGALTGTDGNWEYGNAFVLGANFFDDIAAGLQVSIDIDATNAGWAVTLGKSALSTDGSVVPPPTSGVPEPAAWAMMISGFGLVGAAARRRRSFVAA